MAMANSAFDPLRDDPFATPQDQTALIAFNVQPAPNNNEQTNNELSPENDVLLQFANTDSTPTKPSQSVDPTDVRQTRKQRVTNHSPRSVASISSMGSTTSRQSSVAPPPDLPIPRDYSRSLFHVSSEADPSTLPQYEKITHSGSCLARISFRTKLLKLWKQVFWIVYDNRELLVFKSKDVFDEWLMNPHLPLSERNTLIKLRVNLQSTYGNFGYQISNMKMKSYRNSGILHQFKLDKYDYKDGPSILAAFGSSSFDDARDLHYIITQLLKVSPVNVDRTGLYQQDDQRSYSERSGSVYSYNEESVRSAPTFALGRTMIQRSVASVSSQSSRTLRSFGY